jgi:hypothetical protein
VAHAARAFPPPQTAYRWFTRFRDDGTWKRLDQQLVARDGQRVGRAAGPTATIIDTQSVKTTKAVGPRGYDAGKKIDSRKRHGLVDTDGRSLQLQVHVVSAQDRDDAPAAPRPPTPSFPPPRKCLPTVSMPTSALRMGLRSWYRLSARYPIRLASRCCRAVGWSSVSLHGSTATGALPGASRLSSSPPRLSCPLPASCCSPGGWRVRLEIRAGPSGARG